jgi:ParB family transcriptional regulator, chromosome partitioning protein
MALESQFPLINCVVGYIESGERLRPVSDAAVKTLAESMSSIGLKQPIYVIAEGGGVYRLVAGAHRVAAAKLLGWSRIPAFEVKMSAVEARKLEIAENLHRAELTALERSEHVAEWIRLTEADASQVETHRKAGQQPGGVSAAARELGVNKSEAHRAVKIDGLTEEAKVAVVAAGLADNQRALLKVAGAPQADQVEAVAAIVADKAKPKAKAPVTIEGEYVVETPEPVTVAQIGDLDDAEFYETFTPKENEHLLKAAAHLRAFVESVKPSKKVDRWLALTDQYHADRLFEYIDCEIGSFEHDEAWQSIGLSCDQDGNQGVDLRPEVRDGIVAELEAARAAERQREDEKRQRRDEREAKKKAATVGKPVGESILEAVTAKQPDVVAEPAPDAEEEGGFAPGVQERILAEAVDVNEMLRSVPLPQHGQPKVIKKATKKAGEVRQFSPEQIAAYEAQRAVS